MSQCTNCGANFVGIPEHPIAPRLCRYCEITELKARVQALSDALSDAIEQMNEAVIVDTAELQEAWQAVLDKHGWREP